MSACLCVFVEIIIPCVCELLVVKHKIQQPETHVLVTRICLIDVKGCGEMKQKGEICTGSFH